MGKANAHKHPNFQIQVQAHVQHLVARTLRQRLLIEQKYNSIAWYMRQTNEVRFP